MSQPKGPSNPSVPFDAAAPDRPAIEILEQITPEEILRRIHAAGFTEETVGLLHLVPLVQVAWADGKVTPRERDRVLEAARSQGIRDDEPAFRTLVEWLATEPTEPFYRQALEAIRGVMLHLGQAQRDVAHQTLISFCTAIASASGGLLGFGRISNEEQARLDLIAAEMERENEAAVRQVLEKWSRIEASSDISVFL